MPASNQSLRLTEFYRERLQVIRIRAERLATKQWERVDLSDLEPTFTDWLGATTSAVSRAQQEAVRLSGAYLTAYLSTELGHRVRNVDIDTTEYAGRSRDGRSLADAFDSPRIGVLVALRDGKDNPGALSAGLERATRMVELDVLHAARSAALDRIEADDRFDGWQRAVRGTCGACAGVARGLEGGTRFQVHPGCFPAGVEVSGPPAVAASKRWYVGDLVELRFDGGGLLTCTPNHPVLTPRGWVAAHHLREADDVVRSVGQQRSVAGVGPDNDERPALIEQVAETLRGAGEVATASVPVAPEDFHGDGSGGDVDIVWADRPLEDGSDSPVFEHLGEMSLCFRHAALFALAGLGAFTPLLEAGLSAASGGVGGLGLGLLLGGGEVALSDQLRFSPSADGHSRPNEAVADYGTADVETGRDGLLAFSHPVGSGDFVDIERDGRAGVSGFVQGHSPLVEELPRSLGVDPDDGRSLAVGLSPFVQTDKVVDSRRVGFAGHVYNLQTPDSWYSANGVIVHNCQCVSEPVVKGAKDRFPRPTGPAIFAAKSEAEQDEMLGPEAAALVRAGEIELADLVAESPLEVADNFITQKPIEALGV